MTGILVDDRINGPADQRPARAIGDFMRDKHKILGPLGGLKPCHNAHGAATDIVDAEQSRLLFQQLLRHRFAAAHVVT